MGFRRILYGPEFIPGGSSAGSAVGVAGGLVAFSLGTDTAGSGRVPAAFDDLFGWKPTRGLLSTRGVVPACRSLDCVSVFANSAEDVQSVLRVVSAFDEDDPFARTTPLLPCPTGPARRHPAARPARVFRRCRLRCTSEGCGEEIAGRGLEVVEIDFSPFLEAARLLYEGRGSRRDTLLRRNFWIEGRRHSIR